MATKLERSNFSVEPYLPERLGVLREATAGVCDSVLGLRKLADFYYGFAADLAPVDFARDVISGLGVTIKTNPEELASVPNEGPCIVVANHPHGMLDGLLVMQLLGTVRPDFRVMANHFLARFVQLRPLFFQINPFGGKEAIRHNIGTTRAATNWLRDGKMLVVFPGGEVSSLNRQDWRVADPKWDDGVARFAEKTGAPVVPMHIGGRNSDLFQLSGLLHPHFRTALLVREMMNKKGTTIDVRFGREVAPNTIASLEGRDQITRYLQTKTYLLKEKTRQKIAFGVMSKNARPPQAVAPEGNPADFEHEIAALPAKQNLFSSGASEVYFAVADQIPQILQEIGRLRELSFREVGEGTGKSSDLDLYDSYYTHLFIWDRSAKRVVGGYRLGHTDRILDTYGLKGLYVHSLFKLSPELTADLRCALELGRSFIRIEYQRSYSSLLLLWKGIGRYLMLHPQFRILFGPLSISNAYHPVSQKILVQFLRHRNSEVRRTSHVKPRRPFRAKSELSSDLIDLDSIDLNIISDLLSTVEPDDKGVPVLLRQYLKFGGHILGFNIDPNFNNSIDCLLWCDLMRTELPLIIKYMGKEGATAFLTLHEHTSEVLKTESLLAS
ncbi:MAG: lysophospholipid acyltransferase family protein [Gammaproteobacteria bacterium]